MSVAIISVRVHAPCILAAASIRGRHLFCSELPIVWPQFEGGVQSKKYDMYVLTYVCM